MQQSPHLSMHLLEGGLCNLESSKGLIFWQVRGSVPLFWTQDSYAQHRLKPEILLQRFDPLYQATRLHYEVLPRFRHMAEVF